MFNFDALITPTTLAEALDIYSNQTDLTLLAGGTDVLVDIKNGYRQNAQLLCIGGLQELRGIRLDEEENLYIGAGVTFAEIIESGEIASRVPSLIQAIYETGGPQLRNMATIGGNICNGACCADSVPCLFAYDAQLQLQTAKDTRVVPAMEFYKGAGMVKLEPGEILTAIIFPAYSYKGWYGKSIKYATREAMDIATLNCSANVQLSPDGEHIEKLRIAYGVAAPTPIRARSAEILAEGRGVSEADITQIAVATLNSVMPRDSARASKDFRLHLIQELAKRTIMASVESATVAKNSI